MRDGPPGLRERIITSLNSIQYFISQPEKVLASPPRLKEIDRSKYDSKNARKKAKTRAKKNYEAQLKAYNEQIDEDYWNILRDDEKHDEMTILQLLHDWIKCTLDNLFRTGEITLSPHRAANDAPAAGTLSQSSLPEDLNRIRRMFPKANEDLIRCLGATTLKRRDILRNRDKYYQPQLHNMPYDSLGPPRTHYKPRDRIPLYDARLFDTLPPPPENSAGRNPFECPYCHFTIVIRHQDDWARHIFDDIRPYSCIFRGCVQLAELHSDRFIWYDRLDSCFLNCIDEDLPVECPLCLDDFDDSIKFYRHLALHMEQVALLALPNF